MFRWSGGTVGIFGKRLAREMPIVEIQQSRPINEEKLDQPRVEPVDQTDSKCESVEIVTEDVIEEKKPKIPALEMDPFLAQLTKK